MTPADHMKAGDELTARADSYDHPGDGFARAGLYLGAISHYLSAIAVEIGATPATPHPAVSGGQ